MGCFKDLVAFFECGEIGFDLVYIHFENLKYLGKSKISIFSRSDKKKNAKG